MVSLVHSFGLSSSPLEDYGAVYRNSGKCEGKYNVSSGICHAHLEVGSLYVSAQQRLLSGRKLRRSKSWRFGMASSLSSPALVSLNWDDTCGCLGKSQFMGKRLSARTKCVLATISSVEQQWTARIDRKPYMSESNKLVEKQREPCIRRSKSGGLVRSSRRSLASLAAVDESEIISKPRCSQVWMSCQRNLMTAAAVAGLSLSLCSSALASPTSSEMASIPNYMQDDVETQLMYQLQAEINAQKDWLEDIGQPLNQWSIDDHIKQKLFVGGEGKVDTKLDESGKTVKIHGVESVVVPVFKPSSVADRVERTNIGEEISQDSQTSSKSLPAVSSSSSVPSVNSTVTHLSTADAPELVAVNAVPLGSVVSVASGSVASIGGTAVATAMSASSVPGLGLMARIMMHFSGGGLAGAMGATIVFPLDTIKTKMQAQKSKEGEEPHYKDEMDCLRQTVSEEGMGALYSGLVPQLIGIAPEKAMKLTVNEILLEMLESEMPGVGVVLLELIAGGGGGFSQVVFTNPMEAVKVRLQTQPKDSKAKNTWQVVKELGLHGLYTGSSVTLARDVPSTAIFFAVYTFIRQMYPEQSFMAACIAAVPSTVIVTPMDVVKTRMQMERTEGEEQYENAWQCFTEILRKEGPGALFKGSGARVLKTSPQFGITLMLYNMLCHLQ